jgi:hypothetical protein
MPPDQLLKPSLRILVDERRKYLAEEISEPEPQRFREDLLL